MQVAFETDNSGDLTRLVLRPETDEDGQRLRQFARLGRLHGLGIIRPGQYAAECCGDRSLEDAPALAAAIYIQP